MIFLFCLAGSNTFYYAPSISLADIALQTNMILLHEIRTHRVYACIGITAVQNQNCLLVIRPRTIIHQDLRLGELVPSPHKRSTCTLSN